MAMLTLIGAISPLIFLIGCMIGYLFSYNLMKGDGYGE